MISVVSNRDLILAKGFDINVKTLRGSALHEAALCGKIEVVRSLLDNGINVEIRDEHDKTVLEIMDELKTQRTREVIHIILGEGLVKLQPTKVSNSSVGKLECMWSFLQK